MCVPAASGGAASDEGLWRGTTDQGQAVRILILDDGTYYILYSQQGTADDAGVLTGPGKYVDGKFTSADVGDYSLGPAAPFVGLPGAINATFVPRASLQMNIGTAKVSGHVRRRL